MITRNAHPVNGINTEPSRTTTQVELVDEADGVKIFLR